MRKHPLDPDNLHSACLQVSDLLYRKQQDYGTRNIEDFGSMGVLVRANDKLSRLKNLTTKTTKPGFESVEDTWLDLAGYAILGLLMHRAESNVNRENDGE